MLLILESLSLSSLVNTFEQWAIRRSLGGEVEREGIINKQSLSVCRTEH